MTLPLVSFSIMTLAASAPQMNTPFKSVSTTSSHSSSLISTIRFVIPIPALQTMVSSLPKVSTVLLTMARTSARFLTSALNGIAVPPISLISSETRLQSSSSRPLITTLAPYAQKATAMPYPSPVVLPVIMATFPVKSNVGISNGVFFISIIAFSPFSC